LLRTRSLWAPTAATASHAFPSAAIGAAGAADDPRRPQADLMAIAGEHAPLTGASGRISFRKPPLQDMPKSSRRETGGSHVVGRRRLARSGAILFRRERTARLHGYTPPPRRLKAFQEGEMKKPLAIALALLAALMASAAAQT